MYAHDRERFRGMERLSISFTDQQLVWLAREAKRLGVSIGELVRRLVDQYREKQIT